jgi:hypothetical protein
VGCVLDRFHRSGISHSRASAAGSCISDPLPKSIPHFPASERLRSSLPV